MTRDTGNWKSVQVPNPTRYFRVNLFVDRNRSAASVCAHHTPIKPTVKDDDDAASAGNADTAVVCGGFSSWRNGATTHVTDKQ